MRSSDLQQRGMWHHFNDEEMVPKDHPLRALLPLVNRVLEQISPRFEGLYADGGRKSIPPERLLRALLLQILYGIRSERLLVEQLQYNFLFRWFVGLGAGDPVWHPTTFTKNRERLIAGDIARAFFGEVVALAKERNLMSDEHFSVDGTQIEAYASHKSFRPKGDDSDGDNFHGTKRSNKTHASTTDPDARLFRKSKAHPAQLAYQGHVLMENRNAIIADVSLTHAHGRAEREAAVELIARIDGQHRVTLGADKGYDARGTLEELRSYRVTPHIAANDNHRGGSTIDGRTRRHRGYDISQHKRKGIEKIFGWIKSFANYRKTRHRGRPRVAWQFTFIASIYNLLRIRKLSPVS